MKAGSLMPSPPIIGASSPALVAALRSVAATVYSPPKKITSGDAADALGDEVGELRGRRAVGHGRLHDGGAATLR